MDVFVYIDTNVANAVVTTLYIYNRLLSSQCSAAVCMHACMSVYMEKYVHSIFVIKKKKHAERKNQKYSCNVYRLGVC